MLKNYFNAAFRSLLREKLNTIINILGLTLGITGALILFLIVDHSHSYDTYHTNADRIFRVVSKDKDVMGESYTQGIPVGLPDAIRNDFPALEAVAFTSYRRGSMISVVQADGSLKKYQEPHGVGFTEPSFFRIFDRPVLLGSAEKGLDEPNEAMISRLWAVKYFGKEDAVGEVILYDKTEFRITGILEDIPSNTDLPFNLMLSKATIQSELNANAWGGTSDSDNCYILLAEEETISSVAQGMPGFVKKYLGDENNENSGQTFLLQPLRDLHSDMRFGNYNKRMPPEAGIAFTIIGLFLLITACINFINLTTASAVKRTREVGIRKVLGSSRIQLIVKYTGETFMVTLAAAVLALVFAELALAFLNPFLELSLSLNLLSDPGVWIFLCVVTVVVSICSGLYPAIVVSAFQPASALKNQVGRSGSGYVLRKGLVVFQFFISQLFIIGTIVIVRQMDFMQQHDLGFEKDAILTIPIPDAGSTSERGEKSGKMRALKNEILRLPDVEAASLNGTPPSANSVTATDFKSVGSEDAFKTQIKQVDGDYLNLFEITLVAGEPLGDPDTLSGVVVNERLARIAGFVNNHDIIGKELDFWGRHVTVKGVVKDFNTMSLSEPIEPVIMINSLQDCRNLSIRINPRDMMATVKNIETVWSTYYPEYIFSYKFMDEQIRNLYRGERKMSTLLSIFSSIAIFIGCLGLFGLVTFMANQKTKEIGIRKVLGASVESVMFMFSKEFVKLILIGFMLAGPIAGFAMRKLLDQFAYRIELGPVIFIAGAGVTFIIAFVTVGFRSWSAARANPADSLRTE
jgi:predicted permease